MATELKTFKKNEVIFGEGSYAKEMYEIYGGTVGIFKDYGTETQVKLAELTEGYFGEMGLISRENRTATAVALEDTAVMPISLEAMEEYFKENSIKVVALMQTMTQRLRNMDMEYMKACECLDACLQAEEAGEKVDEEILKKMKEFAKNI